MINYSYLFILVFLILFFLLFIKIYIKWKFRFWSLQPVFHIYDLHYTFFPPGIILHSLPEKNRYTNFKNIETILYTKLTVQEKNKFIFFIKNNFLRNNGNHFLPNNNNIFPYFNSHNHPCFFSYYTIDEHSLDTKTQTIIHSKKIISVMTSRPLYLTINNGNSNAKMNIYYVDYLCVHKENRNKGIAPEIIQTHEYNQRHINKKISVSLFKREGKLTGIVPLTVYNTYGFKVDKWCKPPELMGIYSILEITVHNIHFLNDFLKENTFLFDIIILPEITNIIELLKTNNIFIYVILLEQTIISSFFFRKTSTFLSKDLEVLTCFASIHINKNTDVFILGFKNIFWHIANKFHFGYSAIENISHNNIIINNLMIKNKPTIISPTAYFFYNFAYPTFPSKKVLIIN
jgi:hypothetical protein